jgi:hypothetical protein
VRASGLAVVAARRDHAPVAPRLRASRVCLIEEALEDGLVDQTAQGKTTPRRQCQRRGHHTCMNKCGALMSDALDAMLADMVAD